MPNIATERQRLPLPKSNISSKLSRQNDESLNVNKTHVDATRKAAEKQTTAEKILKKKPRQYETNIKTVREARDAVVFV